jgi:hypothetical protein
MGNQRETTSELQPREWGTSPGRRRLSLGVGLAPEPARAELPSAYGVPLLELLIVDPYFLFVSWEIPPSQLEQAAAELGAPGFEARQLELRVLAGADGEVLARQRLYGETGRWFLRHGLAGRAIFALLGFNAGGRYCELNRTGVIQVPRDFMIEPAEYDELHVRYGSKPDGALVLEGLSRKSGASWPELDLPAPSLAELVDIEDLSVSGGAMPSSPGAGMPTSPAPDGRSRLPTARDGKESTGEQHD